MHKLIATGVLMAMCFGTTGCIKVIEGDRVFSVQAQKFIIGPGIKQAEEKIPSGATITTVVANRALFGLMQVTVISGTK